MSLRQVVSAVFFVLFCSGAHAGPVNVNTADAETLASELTGIGLSKARAIVAYRTANGPFTDIAELANVKGVGARLLEKNLDDVRLSDPD
ncbi:MAG: ComEA family DNA-binding protein [Pseudomonadota bacterium]